MGDGPVMDFDPESGVAANQDPQERSRVWDYDNDENLHTHDSGDVPTVGPTLTSAAASSRKCRTSGSITATSHHVGMTGLIFLLTPVGGVIVTGDPQFELSNF